MRLFFFYPARNLGGAQLLFYRLATLLSSRGFHVFYVDFEDGYAAKKFFTDRSEVTLVKYLPGKSVDVPEGSVIVAPLSFFGVLSRVFRGSGDIRTVFWCLHPLNVPIQLLSVKIKGFLGRWGYDFFLFLFARVVRKSKRSLEVLGFNNSVFFMDESNFDEVSRFFGLSTCARYLPIFLDHNEKESRSDNSRQMAWLGRIDKDSKYYILKRIIADYIKSDQEKPFLIIGDGAGRSTLEAYFKDYSHKLDFIGEVDSYSLTSVLKDVGMVFAMGTSCLEAAARNKIVIQVDAFYHDVPLGYKYGYFYDVEGYSLGRVITPGCEVRGTGYFFSELVDCLRSPGSEVAAMKSNFRYVEKFSAHSFENKFNAALESSRFSLALTASLFSWFDFLFFKIRGFFSSRKRLL